MVGVLDQRLQRWYEIDVCRTVIRAKMSLLPPNVLLIPILKKSVKIMSELLRLL